ncbi:UNVERIFIED_CONTAM: Major allergen Pru ar 1 [Sesamum calycinum]|uniref:Major allergen Pru ar 1 n=1 Tax=Sesamum calycinum TaxID=2727403 RepID=A0AAW2QLK0_9LAMI
MELDYLSSKSQPWVPSLTILRFLLQSQQFKAVVLDADTLIPKIMPQAIKNVEILEGDGGVGTVKIIHFGVLESITYHVKIVPTEDGGCICKNRSIYHTKGDVEISEEKIKEGKEKALQMLKAIEAYLQANPDA